MHSGMRRAFLILIQEFPVKSPFGIHSLWFKSLKRCEFAVQEIHSVIENDQINYPDCSPDIQKVGFASIEPLVGGTALENQVIPLQFFLDSG